MDFAEVEGGSGQVRSLFLSLFSSLFYKVVQRIGGGSVIKGVTLFSLIVQLTTRPFLGW